MQQSHCLPANTPRFRPDHAFIVQFQDSRIDGQGVSGKVEHLESGKAGRFHSREELMSFVDAVLATLSEAAGANGGQPEPLAQRHAFSG